jgi:hypothetical protein
MSFCNQVMLTSESPIEVNAIFNIFIHKMTKIVTNYLMKLDTVRLKDV